MDIVGRKYREVTFRI